MQMHQIFANTERLRERGAMNQVRNWTMQRSFHSKAPTLCRSVTSGEFHLWFWENSALRKLMRGKGFAYPTQKKILDDKVLPVKCNFSFFCQPSLPVFTLSTLCSGEFHAGCVTRFAITHLQWKCFLCLFNTLPGCIYFGTAPAKRTSQVKF